MTISVSSNLVLKASVNSIAYLGTPCPTAKREANSLLTFLKAECKAKTLAWQVYSETKKLAMAKGLLN
jgi:hypothetical protein